MHWQPDHVFLACPDKTIPEKTLSDFGIAFTESRIHRGQGTANVCALFENAFFELLFPSDDAELESEAIKPLGLKARINWRETGACPFGVCFRPVAPLYDDDMPPVETWSYGAAYLPEGAGIPIVTPQGSIEEPLVFLSTRARPAAIATGTTPGHRGACRTLTDVVIEHPANARPSAGVQWFAQHTTLSLVPGPGYRLTLVWDDGTRGERFDFEGPLPLSITW